MSLQLESDPQFAGKPNPGLLAESRVLWATAPAWRNMLIGGLCLASMGVSASFLEPQSVAVASETVDATESNHVLQTESKEQTCGLRFGQFAPDAVGTVVRFMTPAEAARAIEVTQSTVHAKLDPAYLQNPRVLVGVNTGDLAINARNFGKQIVAIVPTTLTVKAGDVVEVHGAQRNPSLPCNYFPNLISRVFPPVVQAPSRSGETRDLFKEEIVPSTDRASSRSK